MTMLDKPPYGSRCPDSYRICRMREWRRKIALLCGVLFAASPSFASTDSVLNPMLEGSTTIFTPPYVQAGFTNVIFNTNFSTASLSSQLSCYNASFAGPWSQGVWWETTAPCSNISIVNDSAFGYNVLDLKWTLAGDAGSSQDDTTIETFPYPYGYPGVVPSHFAFQYGYYEAVMRVSTAATGVWPAIWMWGDTTVTQQLTAADGWTSSLNAPEFDVF